MHEDPIPSFGHLPRNLGITGFVGIPEVPPPQVKKIEGDAESNENGNLNPLLRIDFGK
jgi:hypothetical protein